MFLSPPSQYTQVGLQLQRELLQDYGVITLPLPAYCPDLNPIELTWSAVKMWMRRYPRGGKDEHLFALGECLNAVDHDLIVKQYRHRHYL